MAESKLITSITQALKQELFEIANNEIEKAERRMENQLQHEKAIIVGKILNQLDIMMREEGFGQGVEITVVFRDERGDRQWLNG